MRRPSPLLVVTATASLVAAACGGSDAQREAFEGRQQSGRVQTEGDPSPASGWEDAESSITVPDAAGGATAAPGTSSNAGGAKPATGRTPAARPASGARRSTPSPAGSAAPRAAGAAATPESPAPGAPAPPGDAPPQAPRADSDVGVTASSIKVGHIGIYSGPVGSFGDDLSYAARAGLQAINDSGGVNGRKLDVLVRDDAWDGTKGMNAARDLIERQKVFAICCIQSVNTSDPLTPYLDQKKIPHVGADGWGEPQFKGAWTFPVGSSAATEGHMLAEYQATKQGVRRVAAIYINNPTGRAFVDAYSEILKQYGGEVVVEQPATFDDSGTTTFIAQARTENVDAITSYIDPGIFARMIREAASQAYKPKQGFSGAAGLYFEATPGLAGPHAEGTIAATHWVTNDMDTSGFRAYRDVVEQYYPNIDHSTWTKAGYVGATIFGNTLKKLGLNVTRQGVKDELDRLTDFDTGLGPKLTFRPGQHRANRAIYLARLERVGNKLEYRYLAGPLVDSYVD